MIDYDFEENCNIINKEALQNKDSQSAIYKIMELYKKMSEYDKRNVDNVIVKWLWDENRRFDALFIIDEFNIYSLKPQLMKLKEELKTESNASTVYDIKKIDIILKKLI